MPETPPLEADERVVRDRLRKIGVGPDAAPPTPIPPKPTTRPRDWLDDLLDTPAAKPVATPAVEETEPAPAAAPAAVTPKKTRKAKVRAPKRHPGRGKRHDPAAARSAWDTRPPAPRQSLVEAWDRVPYRLKWLAYHASAAYLGWSLGLVDWVTYVTAWIFRTGVFGPQAIFWCCVGAATFLIHHLTRHRWLPVAWLGAVPASSLVVGVLLYGTGYHQ